MKTLSDEKFQLEVEKLQNSKMVDLREYIKKKDVKEFIKWVETEIVLKSPKRRQNLIKLQNRVGEKLI